MPGCKKYGSQDPHLCTGDMRHRINILARAIQVPTNNGVDFGMGFTLVARVWAAINTKAGDLFSDGTNIEQTVSYEFLIKYRDDIDRNKVINFNGDYYVIADAEDVNKRKEVLVVSAIIRGPDDILANYV